MAKLTKPIKREIVVHGVGPLIVSIDEVGVTFKVKGTRTGVDTPWSEVLRHCSTPTNVPSFLYGYPREFLINQADKQRKKKEGK